MVHENRRRAIAAAVLMGSLAVASGAKAAEEGEPEPRRAEPLFGQQGHVVLQDLVGLSSAPLGILPSTGAIGFSIGWFYFATTKQDQPSTPANTSTVMAFAPSLDVFVTDHLTIGGRTSFSVNRQEAGTSPVTVNYGGGLLPRIGWVFPLGEGVSLWPRAFAGASIAGGDGVSSAPSWAAGADALVVVALGRHAALDAGPRIAYERYAGAADSTLRAVTVGVAGGLSLVF